MSCPAARLSSWRVVPVLRAAPEIQGRVRVHIHGLWRTSSIYLGYFLCQHAVGEVSMVALHLVRRDALEQLKSNIDMSVANGLVHHAVDQLVRRMCVFNARPRLALSVQRRGGAPPSALALLSHQ